MPEDRARTEAAGAVATTPRYTIDQTMKHGSLIPKLTTENYVSWREMIELTFYVQQWTRAITDDVVEDHIEKPAKLLVLTSMDEQHRGMTRGLSTVKKTLQRLEQIYADKSATNLYRMLHNYYRYTKRPEDDIHVHIGKMQEMRSALADVGEKQSEALFHVTLIASLPQEYGNLLEVWEMAHPEMRTTEQLTNRLTKREEDLKKESMNKPETLFVAARSRHHQQSIEERKKHSKCNSCQETGHWAAECPNKGKVSTPRERGERIFRANFMMAVADVPGAEKVWIADCGASRHMCMNPNYFTSLKFYDKPGKIYVGNDGEVDVMGEGTVDFESTVQGKKLSGTLKGVLFAPDLSLNIVSVGSADREGVVSNFDNGCVMSKKATGQVVAVAPRVGNNLYPLKLRALTRRALVLKPKRTLEEWHRALGHPGKARLSALAKDPGNEVKIEGQSKTEDCIWCRLGKGERCAHPTRTTERETKAGVKAHVDLSGRVNKESLEGDRYYLVSKDEATEYCHLYCLPDKSAVTMTLALNQLFMETERECGERVRTLQSDCGSEFVNYRTKILFAKEQVVHETTAPYTPAQNGLIEREMRTIGSCARTMLLESKLPFSLWSEAVRTACHLRNILPTSRSELSPYERFKGTKPKYSHLLPFGTEVQVLVKGHHLTKFEPRTEKGFIVGYTWRCNTYRVYLDKAKRVIESSDVAVSGNPEPESVKSLTRKITGEEGETTVVFTKADNPTELAPNKPPVIASTPSTRSSSENDLFTTGVDQSGAGQATSTPAVVVPKNGRRVVRGEELVQFFETFREQNRVSESNENTLTGDQLGENEAAGGANSGGPENPTTTYCPPLPPRPDSEGIIGSTNGETPPPLPPPRLDSVQSEGRENNEVPPPLPPRPNAPESLPETQAMPDRLLMLDYSSAEHAADPLSYEQALSGPNAEFWADAIKSELEAHATNGTWVEVDRPGQASLTAKWVFTTKRDCDGGIERFKARLVVRGCQQRPGHDYTETYAPVSRIESIRAMLAVSVALCWNICQFDVSTAFLNGTVEEDIYMAAPKGVKIAAGKCLKLIKSLYGLKQAPRVWNSTLQQALKAMGFKPTVSDACIYKEVDGPIVIIVYVDDGLVMGPDLEGCKRIVRELNKRFTVKLLSGDQFLGMELKRTKDSLILTQQRYTEAIIKRFNMEEAHGVSTPIVGISDLVQQVEGERLTTAPYQEAIGCLQYLANHTRPDIAFAVNLLSRFSLKATERHWTAVKRVFKYLRGTAKVGLIYNTENVNIDAYTDADWGSDHRDRVSTSGVLILIAGGPVAYAARRQPTVAGSSCESEYIAANETVKELTFLIQLLDELKIRYEQPTLLIDNKSASRQIQNPDTQRRSKHIDIKFHYIREVYQKRRFAIREIPTEIQAADMLTKAMSGPRLARLREISNVGPGKQPKIGLMAATAMVCMSLLTLGAVVESLELLEADPILWVPTIHKVTNGVKMGTVEFTMIDPCTLPNQNDWHSNLDVKRKSYRVLQEKCRSTFLDSIGPALDRLAQCYKAPPKPRRIKRFEPITWSFIALGFIVVAAVGAVVSGYKVVQEMQKDIEQHNSTLKSHTAELEQLKRQVIQAQSIRSDTISLIEKLDNATYINRRAIEDLSAISPSIAWEATQLNQRIVQDAASLEEISRSCLKNRMDAQALHRLIPSPELDNILAEDTYLEEVTRLNNNTFRFRFAIDQVARDTSIFQITGVSHHINLTTEPTLVKYEGPKYVVHNDTSGCTKGIKEPMFASTYAPCLEKDFTDPGMKNWVPAIPEEQGAKQKPIAYRLGKENLIYCLFNNITVNRVNQRCPPYPFVLPVNAAFNLSDHIEHVVSEQLFLKREGETVSLGKVTLRNDTLKTDDRLLDLIEALKRKNDLVLEHKMEVDNERIIIPIRNAIEVVVVIALGIFVRLAWLAHFKREPTPGRQGGLDQINVYAAPAQQPMVIPAYPPLSASNHLYDTPRMSQEYSRNHGPVYSNPLPSAPV